MYGERENVPMRTRITNYGDLNFVKNLCKRMRYDCVTRYTDFELINKIKKKRADENLTAFCSKWKLYNHSFSLFRAFVFGYTVWQFKCDKM